MCKHFCEDLKYVWKSRGFSERFQYTDTETLVFQKRALFV